MCSSADLALACSSNRRITQRRRSNTDKFPISALKYRIVRYAWSICFAPAILQAQVLRNDAGQVTGTVADAATKRPIPDVLVLVEGARSSAYTDSLGRFILRNVPLGRTIIRAQRIGFAPSRTPTTVMPGEFDPLVIFLARHALQLEGIQVLGDPGSRARGELGTATVIEAEAIRNQIASSLAGILELSPGIVLNPPGLDNVQQVGLRSAPISFGSATAGDPSSGSMASFGTQIIVDGIPASNNANLQSLGPRSEVSFSTASGGGIDLRRIPASTIERVEVIRGVPSVRYGDLTQGAIVVETRTGAMAPETILRVDPATSEESFAFGRQIAARQTGAITVNVAQTKSSGTRDDQALRIATQIAHRMEIGSLLSKSNSAELLPRIVLDSRFDWLYLDDDKPETGALRGAESNSRETGVRFSERGRWNLSNDTRVDLTLAYESAHQSSFSRRDLLRPAFPLTTRLTPGRETGHYLGGFYNARANVDGKPQFFYARQELAHHVELLGGIHDLRAGAETRHEKNEGEGYQFDMNLPPQAAFNGVRGFDRPRSFAEISPLANVAAYVDDRISHLIGKAFLIQLQAGVRAEGFGRGRILGRWQDFSVQPRVNIEISPASRVRLRGGIGKIAKLPTLDQLTPRRQYFDVINVNFFANAPEERLAVLTTYIFDPKNPDLKYVISKKSEAGFEFDFSSSGTVELVGFRDEINNGIGVRPEVASIVRDNFNLTNTAPGSGRPPELIQPPRSSDPVPVIIERPANNVTLASSGFELTTTMPDIYRLHLRIAVQGSYVKSKLIKAGVEFDPGFGDFQLNERAARSPYYKSIVRTGDRFLLTTRFVHHKPAIGLVITGTIQHTVKETRQNLGATDTLAFEGFVTRNGALVPVDSARRGLPEYTDLRLARKTVLTSRQSGPIDWLFNLQVSKSLPLGGRLSFYAFNAFDRIGHYGSGTVATRIYPSSRFGAELSLPLGWLAP